MNRVKLLTIIAAALSVVAVLLGFLFSQSEQEAGPGASAVNQTSPGLGITYLEVTRGLSEYYGLGVDYGALVTEVAPGSPAEQAGLQAGDVILSFNGAALEAQTPLLGMMMACPVGDTVRMEVWRGTEVRMITFFHGSR